jgi:hypothetical protein
MLGSLKALFENLCRKSKKEKKKEVEIMKPRKMNYDQTLISKKKKYSKCITKTFLVGKKNLLALCTCIKMRKIDTNGYLIKRQKLCKLDCNNQRETIPIGYLFIGGEKRGRSKYKV